MEKRLYDEMVENVKKVNSEINLSEKRIFLFGHCNATLELIDLLESMDLMTKGILDNSDVKQGQEYKGAVVIYPRQIGDLAGEDSVVLITSRFYAAMLQQLRELGYEGPVRKVIDYNTYAEYSLSVDTMSRMKARERHGAELLEELSKKYNQHFKVFCPFNALGDIYFMISYWPAYAKKRSLERVVFCVPNPVLADVIHMFGDYPVETYEQKELDAMIQSVIYTQDENCFIAHQDRPYVVNLSKALYIKRIPLEKIYCCGVYGLPVGTVPDKPNSNLHIYKDIASIPDGRAVILSPYAKSVTAIDPKVWEEAVNYYTGAGYKCYTNVIGDEKPLDGTDAISPSLLEIRSVVERAGTFVGIRSGLCDILREAKAKKIALYPDYNYCDTKWKSIEMYNIEKFDYNLLATEAIEWAKL
ncbi:hypothetical protein [Oribacterium sp. NK2B42]|uniref:hypothetical protein n=1 Tax=Oribacterium sp. NK2B42 TaxID=689781 RepID=UPI000417C312|nr:hypothetical protein [Oribacterium sp. NK2B42]